jgi:hypothetical protein
MSSCLTSYTVCNCSTNFKQYSDWWSIDLSNPVWIPPQHSIENLESCDGFDSTDTVSYFHPGVFSSTPHLPSPQIEFSASAFQEVVNESTDHGPLSGEAIQSVFATGNNPLEGTWEQSTSKLIESTPVSAYIRSVSDRSLSLSSAGPSASSPQTPSIENASSATQPPQDPPRNATGYYICDYSGCTDTQTFPRRSDWQ